MSKIKNYMMDIEEKIYSMDGFEDKVSESENTSEVKDWVIEKLGMTTSLCFGVNDGDYITVRASLGNASDAYIYGGNNNYNNWQVFYLPGAQNNQG